MKKVILLSFFMALFASSAVQAQIGVGINTENPRATLDVNGGILLRGPLRIATDTTTLTGTGSTGTSGLLLSSRGANKAPEWVKVNIPVVTEGSLALLGSQVLRDRTGLDLNRDRQQAAASTELAAPHPENLFFSTGGGAGSTANWYAFPELFTTIEIPDYTVEATDPVGTVYNRTAVQIQTVVQIGTSAPSNPWITYSLGVFIFSEDPDNPLPGNTQPALTDYQLKGVRVGRISGTSASFFETFDLTTMVDNLDPGRHFIMIAALRRNSNATTTQTLNFSIGKPSSGQTNLNNFMTQTTLRIDVYERVRIL